MGRTRKNFTFGVDSNIGILDDSQAAATVAKSSLPTIREIKMNSEVLTIGVLALVVAGGWVIDLINQHDTAKFRRELASHLKKASDSFHGAH
jgi:hypothetical protein